MAYSLGRAHGRKCRFWTIRFPCHPRSFWELQEALQSIRYGTVELVIHDGRVVQLERREKVRFEHGDTEYKRA